MVSIVTRRQYSCAAAMGSRLRSEVMRVSRPRDPTGLKDLVHGPLRFTANRAGLAGYGQRVLHYV